jgi:hypothetical protein
MTSRGALTQLTKALLPEMMISPVTYLCEMRVGNHR